MTFTIELELLLAVGLVYATIPLHEYGHKLAYRVLGFNAHIIWNAQANEHWWSACACCVPEESFDNFRGTMLDFAFVAGSGGAVQALVFVFPMMFLESFGLFTMGCVAILIYMFYEIITKCRTIEWEPDDQKEGKPYGE